MISLVKLNTNIWFKIVQLLIVSTVSGYGVYCICNMFIDKLITVVATLLIFVLLQMLDKLLKCDLSMGIKTASIGMVFLTIFLGETLDFYITIKFWDKIVHFLAGIIFYWYFIKIYKDVLKDSKIGVLPIIYVLGLAVLWEVIEFISDTFFYTNMQSSKLIHQNGLKDTMQDIIMSFTSSVLIHVFFSIKNNFVKKKQTLKM